MSIIQGLIKVAHRGSPHDFPANTIQGFRTAVERGCDMVECDIRQSSDGRLMLAHDDWVRDRNGDRFSVSRETASTLRSLDLGANEGVPTLHELVELCMETVQPFAIMADMKCGGDGTGVEADVVRALACLGEDRKLVPGAGPTSRSLFRSIDPALRLSLSCGRAEVESDEDAFQSRLSTIDTYAVTWEHPLLTRRRIELLHDRGIQVFAWTVDDAEIMRRLIEDGVDGVISNRIDLLVGLP